MKRLFISFFAVSIFISCSVFAQTSLIDKLKENSQKACGTGEFTSADSLNYGIDWKSTDPNVTIGDSALAKALGSTKSEYLLTACVSGTDAKVTLYIKYTQTTDKIFMASYSGKVAEGGEEAHVAADFHRSVEIQRVAFSLDRIPEVGCRSHIGGEHGRPIAQHQPPIPATVG
ncbi:MAG: hypothetical protein WCQ53_08975, partial [bacterium]